MLEQNTAYQPNPGWRAPEAAASKPNPLAKRPEAAAGGKKLFLGRRCLPTIAANIMEPAGIPQAPHRQECGQRKELSETTAHSIR
jgi:hypothetical protein